MRSLNKNFCILEKRRNIIIQNDKRKNEKFPLPGRRKRKSKHYKNALKVQKSRLAAAIKDISRKIIKPFLMITANKLDTYFQINHIGLKVLFKGQYFLQMIVIFHEENDEQ